MRESRGRSEAQKQSENENKTKNENENGKQTKTKRKVDTRGHGVVCNVAVVWEVLAVVDVVVAPLLLRHYCRSGVVVVAVVVIVVVIGIVAIA